CRVIAPVVALMVGATPVMLPIAVISVPTLSVMSITGGTAARLVPVLTKLIVVPSTVMVSPFAKEVGSESEGAIPDSFVAAVIGAGVAAWFTAPVPVRVVSVNGAAGVPT